MVCNPSHRSIKVRTDGQMSSSLWNRSFLRLAVWHHSGHRPILHSYMPPLGPTSTPLNRMLLEVDSIPDPSTKAMKLASYMTSPDDMDTVFAYLKANKMDDLLRNPDTIIKSLQTRSSDAVEVMHILRPVLYGKLPNAWHPICSLDGDAHKEQQQQTHSMVSLDNKSTHWCNWSSSRHLHLIHLWWSPSLQSLDPNRIPGTTTQEDQSVVILPQGSIILNNHCHLVWQGRECHEQHVDDKIIGCHGQGIQGTCRVILLLLFCFIKQNEINWQDWAFLQGIIQIKFKHPIHSTCHRWTLK